MLLVLVLCRAEPPKEMPEELVKAYTMNGKAEQARFFVDDTNGGKGSHYKVGERVGERAEDGLRRGLRSGSRRGARTGTPPTAPSSNPRPNSNPDPDPNLVAHRVLVHFQYARSDIDHMIQLGRKQIAAFKRRPVQSKQTWLIKALVEFPIDGKDVAVFGSMEPWCVDACRCANPLTLVVARN